MSCHCKPEQGCLTPDSEEIANDPLENIVDSLMKTICQLGHRKRNELRFKVLSAIGEAFMEGIRVGKEEDREACIFFHDCDNGRKLNSDKS